MIYNKIANEDCLSGLKKMDPNIFDLVVTSPPYFVGKAYNEGADYLNFSDVNKEWKEYSDWLVEVMHECVRVLKPGGKLAINIDDRHTSLTGSNIVLPTHSKLVMSLYEQVDYKEMILWKKIRKASAKGGSDRLLGSYGTHKSPGEIPILQEVEYILLFRKHGNRDITTEMRIESALLPEEFSNYGMQIWDVQPEINRIHPASFPVEIPHRIIKLFTFKNDFVLDPFMGSGSTAIASIKNGRNYYGFELNKEYHEISEDRISSFLKSGQDSSFMKITSMFSRKKQSKDKTSRIF